MWIRRLRTRDTRPPWPWIPTSSRTRPADANGSFINDADAGKEKRNNDYHPNALVV